jgi:hypothetical protein
VTGPCPPPISPEAVAEHVAGCARCRGNIAAAAVRAAESAGRDAATEREHVERLHVEQARRAAEWPVERFRALMAEVGG